MSYSASLPPQLLVPRMGSGKALWSYTSGDARATVEGSLYFANGVALGMKLGDHVIVSYTTGYVTTIHSVSVVGTSAVTINAAVLA